MSNQHQYLRGLQFASPIRDVINGRRNPPLLSEPQPNPRHEALRVYLFPFIKMELMHLIKEYPIFFTSPKSAQIKVQASQSYSDIEQIETMQYSELVHFCIFRHISHLDWQFAHYVIERHLDKMDWAIVFPNDVFVDSGAHYIMPRVRVEIPRNHYSASDYHYSECSITASHEGSVWTRSKEVYAHISRRRHFFVISQPFTPTQKGVWIGNCDSVVMSSEVVLCNNPVKIDMGKTLDFMKKVAFYHPLAYGSEGCTIFNYLHWHFWYHCFDKFPIEAAKPQHLSLIDIEMFLQNARNYHQDRIEPIDMC